MRWGELAGHVCAALLACALVAACAGVLALAVRFAAGALGAA